MPVTVTNIGTATGASGATLVITLGAAIPAGQLLVVAVTEKSTSGVSGTLADTAANTWNTAIGVNLNAAAASGRGTLFYAWNSKALANGNTITYTRNLTAASCSMSAFWVSGIQSNADPRDSGVQASATGSTGTITVTSTGNIPQWDWILGALFDSGTSVAGGSATFTQASNYATPPNEATTGGSAGSRVNGGNQRNVGAAASFTYAPTLSSTAQVWADVITAFRSIPDNFFIAQLAGGGGLSLPPAWFVPFRPNYTWTSNNLLSTLLAPTGPAPDLTKILRPHLRSLPAQPDPPNTRQSWTWSYNVNLIGKDQLPFGAFARGRVLDLVPAHFRPPDQIQLHSWTQSTSLNLRRPPVGETVYELAPRAPLQPQFWLQHYNLNLYAGAAVAAAVGSASGIGSAAAVGIDATAADTTKLFRGHLRSLPDQPAQRMAPSWTLNLLQSTLAAGGSVGSAAGTGTATGVGTAIKASVGNAAGTGAAAGIGSSTAASSGAAAGTGAATGTGAAIFAGVGAAAGTGTAAGAGSAVAASVGSATGSGAAVGLADTGAATGNATGTGAAAAVGQTIKGAAGNAAGTGAAAGVGSSTAASSGAASGTGTAAGVGLSIFSGVGASAGTGAAAAASQAVIGATGAAAGTGAASGIGSSTAASSGAASGTGAASGVGSSTAASVGSASGVGTGSGFFVNGPAIGNAAGSGAAAAVGTAVKNATGNAAGAGAATGVGAATAASSGAAAGIGSATGVGASTMAGVGAASGTGAAAGVGSSVAAATGSASGVGTGSAFFVNGPAIGNALGTGTAAAVGQAIKSAVGAAAGTGAAAARAPSAAVGNASGIGAAAAVGVGVINFQTGAGSAAGTGTASAVGRSTAAAAGHAQGVGTALGDSGAQFRRTDRGAQRSRAITSASRRPMVGPWRRPTAGPWRRAA